VGLSVDPNQPLDIRQFGIAFANVAGVATALVLGCGIFAGPIRSWLRPRWVHPVTPWNGFAIVAVFVLSQLAAEVGTKFVVSQGHYSTFEPDTTRLLSTLAARIVVTPVFFGFLTFVLALIFQSVRIPTGKQIAGWMALGALAWFVIASMTLAIHILTLVLKQEIGGPMDVHPLAKVHPTNDGLGGVIFLVAVCVMTPWVEEYFFRGVVLPWVVRASYRPWLLVVWAFGFAFHSFGTFDDPHYGAVLFVAIGALLLGLCETLPKTKPKRTILAIISTSILFGAVHSSVWPSPIPLFVLALGLGHLTVRTGSIIPAVMVHGLFNGVSFVYLLRGSV
jgi:membrane protease YdiL (CAAX protease family)